jgi:hypothetical protein
MDDVKDRDNSDAGKLGLEELKALVVSRRLSVAEYYRELDRRGVSHG